MKKLLTFIFLSLNIVCISAQDRGAIPMSVSYLGHFGFQPGIKVGTEFPLMGRSNTENYSMQWYVSPQIGFFTNPGSDSNYLLNFETGFKKQKKGKNSYTAFALGLGYRIRSKITSFSVNLGTGNQSNRQRETQGFLLPTLNYERGWRTDRPLSWFFKTSAGITSFSGDENQFMLFTEFGVKFRIKQETKPQVK